MHTAPHDGSAQRRRVALRLAERSVPPRVLMVIANRDFDWREYGETRQELAALTARIERGELAATVDRVYPMEEAAEAHRRVAQLAIPNLEDPDADLLDGGSFLQLEKGLLVGLGR